MNANIEEKCELGDTVKLGIDTQSCRPTEQASSTESPLLVHAVMIEVAEKEMIGWQKVLHGLICLKRQ